MITVFTAGCFDGMHEGHLNLLRRARALGDRLIVAINHDAHLAKKGPGRPLFNESERARALFATGLVDEIHVIGSSPLDVILRLKPDIIVAGSDYTEKTCVGAKECVEWGGKVVILPRTEGISTTQIVDNLTK